VRYDRNPDVREVEERLSPAEKTAIYRRQRPAPRPLPQGPVRPAVSDRALLVASFLVALVVFGLATFGLLR
jgi:hypothetical protein